MKAAAIALAFGAMVTVDQRDLHRSALDYPASAVSADGRYVAFVTYARLADADTDNIGDVYVLDRVRQQITFESTDVTDNVDCFHPDISADGRYLVYDAVGSIVWRDRAENVTRIVGEGRQPTIAETGGTVAFASLQEIYTVDVRTGISRRASVDLPGFESTLAASARPSVSSDGRYVAFSARLRGATGTSPPSHVFVRDALLNTTRKVGSGWSPSITGDGQSVAVVDRIDGVNHIYVASLQTGSTHVITKSVAGGRANAASANPAISSDGNVIVFQSQANDLVRGEDFNLLWDVFSYNRATATMTRISGDPSGVWMEPSIGPSLDASGSVIAFSSRHPTGVGDKRNDFDLYVAVTSKASTHAAQ